MEFVLNENTHILSEHITKAVDNAICIINRDMERRLLPSENNENYIKLQINSSMCAESFSIDVGEDITIYASDELGFVYGLLYISDKFMGIKPFWFWMDQKIDPTDKILIPYGRYESKQPIIKYRGWFVNDEVLIMKWSIDGDTKKPWGMVFEALLRCGGNMVISGTDKNSKTYRQTAADMGLWITHHHAEPIGAEMFVRSYPGMQPNYAQTPELFIKLWEDAVKNQKDLKVIWGLGFRGQGDCPFWSHDSSGKFDTPEKRGALISDVIEKQRQIVLKHVKNPVFCTNLYGEIMELYDDGHIDFADDIIKISADNGYGKMVTRRRDNHVVRICSMPKQRAVHSGIYYHVSFYDLQAANHITMLPNSVDFVDGELTEVINKNATDYWIINCSNVRPHTYFLDAIRKKWYGYDISDKTHSVEFSNEYYNGIEAVATAYSEYHTAMLPYGMEEDEHAGEQFYTENIRLLVHAFFNQKKDGTPGLRWLVGIRPLDEQVQQYVSICKKHSVKIHAFYKKCIYISNMLKNYEKCLFDATLLLHVYIHATCIAGVVLFGDGYDAYTKSDFKKAFIKLGESAEKFESADKTMRNTEYGVWNDFYANECFADVKHTAYMIKKMMGYVREIGDNARHDKWYRDAVYSAEDRDVMTLLVNDNHMTDWELFEAFKKKEIQ